MTKHAMMKQIDGLAFAAKGDSNHWVMMDGPASVGGMDAGSRPKELVLYALAGCTASDVVNILKKKRVPLQGFEMFLTGEEAEEHPKVFMDIHVEYVFFGEGMGQADVERAIELSTKKLLLGLGDAYANGEDYAFVQDRTGSNQRINRIIDELKCTNT